MEQLRYAALIIVRYIDVSVPRKDGVWLANILCETGGTQKRQFTVYEVEQGYIAMNIK